MKIRTVDRSGTVFFDKLGASPTQLPWGELVPSLASGIINGVTTSSSSAVDGKFWEFLSHCSQFHWQSSSNMVNVNLDAWNRLEPEHQGAIEQLARQLEVQFWEAAVDEDEVNLATLAENGMEVSSPSPELKAGLVAVAKEMWAEFIQGAPEARDVIRAYRNSVGK